MSDELKLQVGKSYRTRAGRKATVTKHVAQYDLYEGTTGNVPCRWQFDGSVYNPIPVEHDGSYDLVAEWEEKPEQAPSPVEQTDGLKLQVGKSYRTRDGRKVKVEHNPHNDYYVFRGELDGQMESWAPSGRYWFHAPREIDLIAEWEEPAKKAEQIGVVNFSFTPPPRPKTFWLVWRPSHGLPRVKHPTRAAAMAEAGRLCAEHGTETFVLRAEAVFNPPKRPEPTVDILPDQEEAR